eukprot:CAMPEP_0114263838 /NCGR_PEP_ID=MMETSP0058-20121206/22794_1 /TAXON_ID=36894 /ORGANISM="Pyramimonas parkeae, CCMP726" /LENGTH=74 /DNA_ID=CAMNT_0001380287 /DNA_START=1 /DNA_END=221 /DNA_ORIENTATION=+
MRWLQVAGMLVVSFAETDDEFNKTSACGPGCHLGGTCYEELARCDCPPYPNGPRVPENPCAVAVMPACELEPGG